MTYNPKIIQMPNPETSARQYTDQNPAVVTRGFSAESLPETPYIVLA
jgi:hypothetical protein